MTDRMEFRQIPIEQLVRGRYQPRHQFGEQELAELSASIRASGIVQPLVVRPVDSGQYEIIAGERRWRAACQVPLTQVPCLVGHYDDERAAAMAMVENINRVDLTPIEIAQSFQQLMDEFGWSHEQLAKEVGQSRPKITNMLRLLRLHKQIQTWMTEGLLSEGHGKVLAGLSKQETQYQLAQWSIARGWSVRQLEAAVGRLNTKEQPSAHIDVDVQRLQTALSDYLGCEVRIKQRGKRYRLEIDAPNLDIFDGVLESIGFNR